MQTSRRQFFGILGAALAGATLDPERLLWVPGAKTIFLPTAKSIYNIGDTIRVRVPARFMVREGQALVPQSISWEYHTVTIANHEMAAQYWAARA